MVNYLIKILFFFFSFNFQVLKKFFYFFSFLKKQLTGDKMMMKQLRWGYDGGGIACGPVSGTHLVEVLAIEDGLLVFVLLSRYEIYERVVVSKVSLFDVLKFSASYYVKNDELDLLDTVPFEDYEYEIGEYPDEMINSKYISLIEFAQNAMNEAVQSNATQEEADIFFKPYFEEHSSELKFNLLTTEDLNGL